MRGTILGSSPNLILGAVVGLLAALVGAGIWAAVTALTAYQVGFMAVGVGLLVGFAVRFAGKGHEPIFGVVGAVLAVLGCVVGNYLMGAWFFAANTGMPYGQVLTPNFSFVVEVMRATFGAMDLLFYAIAAYCGYRYSLVPAAAPGKVQKREARRTA
jgi:hypothetical protein